MSIKIGNLGAIAYHLEKGGDNGDITREALALFLRGVADEMKQLAAERDGLLNERSAFAVELAFANYAINWRLKPRVAELEAELAECRAVIAKIDIAAPLADETCLEPGITLSEAVRRQLQEQPQ